MKGTSKVGAYAALVQGVLFIVLLVIFLIVLPSQGVSSPKDLLSAAKAAAVAPILALISLIALVFSGSVGLVVMALAERLQAGAPNRMRYAIATAFVASVLFLANSMLGIVGGQILAQVTDAGLIGPANIAFAAVSQGLLGGAIFAASLSGILWASAGLSTRGLPATLCYVVFLGGVVGITQLFVAPLQLVLFVLSAIWSFWLGSVLLRAPAL